MADNSVKEFVNSIVNDQSNDANDRLLKLLKQKCADRIKKCLDNKS